MRTCTVLLVLLSFFSAAAERVEAPIESLSYHYRLRLKSRGETNFGLKWNETDSANYRYATVETFGVATEDAWAETVNIIIGNVENGKNTICVKETLSGDFDLYRLGISLRMEVGENGALLMIGSRQIVETYDVDYDRNLSSYIYGHVGCDADILRNDLRISQLEAAKYANFENIEELAKYIGNSKDPYEGFWRYFDRNTDPLRSQLGGTYILASVKTDDGYDIVYIDGAETKKNEWQALRIKGHLNPTAFAGSFDLQWIEPSGRPIDFEASATIANNLLTISLPYWKSEVRFSRLQPNDI